MHGRSKCPDYHAAGGPSRRVCQRREQSANWDYVGVRNQACQSETNENGLKWSDDDDDGKSRSLKMVDDDDDEKKH